MTRPKWRSTAPRPFAGIGLAVLLAIVAARPVHAADGNAFEVNLKPGLVTSPQTGRLLVILGHHSKPEPRTLVEDTDPGAPVVLGTDAKDFSTGKTILLDQSTAIASTGSFSGLPDGDYTAQALLIVNRDLLAPDAPGNLYSAPRSVRLDHEHPKAVKLELLSAIPPEELPADTDLVKFIKIQSPLLSAFYGRPIFLRAGIILPRDFASQPDRRYPLWVRIGGLDTRYSDVLDLMDRRSPFRRAWLATDAPPMVLLHLDGAGPHGDPYQVNSANNGPYGDAVTRELIPYVESHFRCAGTPHSRVLSGVSTGGWVSLALQIFYPDYFNGVWSSCPDGVDFRAFQLVNIYQDDNAYVNRFGFERPSERTTSGDVELTMRREVQLENVMGRGNSWTLSGGQWGDWNATYGPRGADGLPVPLWDPQTGRINHDVAAQWKGYDLRLVLEQNWKTLAPKLRGKIHIAAGEADNYFLNNAVHLLDNFLSHADPPFEGHIAYGPGKGHGWSDVSEEEMLRQMAEATR
jgi:hypothetical protein